MFFPDDSHQARCKVEFEQHPHKGHASHELVAGAAAYEALHEYQKKCEREGRPQSHQQAKAIGAAIAAAMVDKLIETKGLDMVDRARAKHAAQRQVEDIIVEKGEFDC